MIFIFWHSLCRSLCFWLLLKQHSAAGGCQHSVRDAQLLPARNGWPYLFILAPNPAASWWWETDEVSDIDPYQSSSLWLYLRHICLLHFPIHFGFLSWFCTESPSWYLNWRIKCCNFGSGQLSKGYIGIHLAFEKKDFSLQPCQSLWLLEVFLPNGYFKPQRRSWCFFRAMINTVFTLRCKMPHNEWNQQGGSLWVGGKKKSSNKCFQMLFWKSDVCVCVFYNLLQTVGLHSC